MAFDFATDRPVVRDSQLLGLVEAVHRADQRDEQPWLEWKSTLDLTAAVGRGESGQDLPRRARLHPGRR